MVEQNGQNSVLTKGAFRTNAADLLHSSPRKSDGLEARVKEPSTQRIPDAGGGARPQTVHPALVRIGDVVRSASTGRRTAIIAALRDLGVPVKMLTGDALAVAMRCARGRTAQHLARGRPEGRERPGRERGVDLLAGADGLRRSFPEDKYIVVQHLQAAGTWTAYGDGVNDAPALRQAEVNRRQHRDRRCQGAASVVYRTWVTNIVAMVEQGRTIYERVLTWDMNRSTGQS